jgi:hypothetical protein
MTSQIGVYIFGNIPDDSLFRFLDGPYKGFSAIKRGGKAWLGAEWFCNKWNLPRETIVNDNERVYLYPEDD